MKKKVYRITITDAASYEIDSSYTLEQAQALAWEWFNEREPEITVEIVDSEEE